MSNRIRSRARLFGVARTWGVPVALAIACLGPALGRGSLFNLDFVVTPRIEVPHGVWGLGPELPRRLPLWVPIAALSPLVPATLVTKLLLVAVFAVAWVGMSRFATSLGVAHPMFAAALYAFGPFMLTRTAVGHFPITVTMAALPWVVTHLLDPGRNLSRTMLSAAALSIGGHFGGSIALLVAVVGVATGRRHRAAAGIGVTIAAQSMWLVPAIAVASTVHIDPSPGTVFGADLRGPFGWLALFSGGGFWNTAFQIGTPVVLAVAGAALLGLAVIGTPRLPPDVRRSLVTLSAIGALVTVLGALDASRPLVEAATSNLVGAVWRDSQRVFVVTLLWLAPTACRGAERLGAWIAARQTEAGAAMTVLPLALAVAVSAPSWWGLAGQLDAEPLPASWAHARSIVRSDDGAIVALPWAQYYDQSFGRGRVRRVLDPMPLFLGGDVIASSDNGLSPDVRERGDGREAAVARAVRQVKSGGEIGVALAALGVEWVVLHHSVLDDAYRSLGTDPRLAVRFDSPEITVFEVVGPRAVTERPSRRGLATLVALGGQVGGAVSIGYAGVGVARRRRQVKRNPAPIHCPTA